MREAVRVCFSLAKGLEKKARCCRAREGRARVAVCCCDLSRVFANGRMVLEAMMTICVLTCCTAG